jgi:hypothetical protein
MTNTNGKVTIRDVYEQIEKLEMKIDKDYVHKSEFEPVKKVVYGLVGLILVTVGTLIMNGTLSVQGVQAIWK